MIDTKSHTSSEEEFLFKDIDNICGVDQDLQQLVIKSERLVGMDSLEFSNEIETHAFHLSYIDLKQNNANNGSKKKCLN